MVKITISDNGGETFDRYIISIGDDVYTMSTHPSDPQGFNQYAGATEDYDSSESEKKITLNEEVLKAILERI